MKRRIWLFPLTIILFSLLAGCGSVSNNYPTTKNKAAELIGNFESAVENYQVTGMLGCLSADDFSLTIWEAGIRDTKAYLELKGELEAEQENQTNWRKPITETGGHAYVLDLILGEINYSNTTGSGTYATQTFEVRESAHEIPPMKTDQGSITWKIVENGGEWKATEMTIEYQALSGTGFFAPKTNKLRGFGFSKLIAQ